MRGAGVLARLSARTARHHLARLLLTLVAVTVSVGFMTGSALLSSTLDRSVGDLMSSDYDGVDIAVRPSDGESSLPGATADSVSAVPGVAVVNTGGDRAAVATPPDADPTTSDDSLPVQLHPWYAADATVTSSPSLTSGSSPGTDEVLVASSGTSWPQPGDTVMLTDGDETYPVTVSGTVAPAEDAGGVTALQMPASDYDRHGSSEGRGPESLLVDVVPGEDADAVAEAVSAALTAEGVTPAPEVRTGADLQADARDMASSTFGFVRYLLAGFSAVAVVAAMFIIANTFAMNVAGRIREFGLLRSIGVSSGQVTASVVVEALFCGVVGTVVGIGVATGGVLAALHVLDNRTGVAVVVPEPFTVASTVLPAVVGVVCTVAAAAVPAVRAGRVSPLAAVRSTDGSGGRPAVLRAFVGVLVLVAGVVAGAAAAFGDGSTGTRASLAGVGALAVLLGVFLVSPAVIGPVSGGLGRLVQRMPVLRLATLQGRRSPRRTAGTAFALVLGLSVVTVTGMFGASLDRSVNAAVDSEVTADFIIAAPSGVTGQPVPGSAQKAVEQTPGVGVSYAVGKAPATVGDPADGVTLVSVSDSDPRSVLDVGETEGTLDLSEGQGVAVSEDFARTHGLVVGDTVEVGVAGQDRTEQLPVEGTYSRSRLLGEVVVSSTAFWRLAPGDRGLGGHRTLAVAVTGDGSTDTTALRAGLEDATASSPGISVQTPADFAGSQTALIDRVVAAGYALAALAVVVAFLGVVNTTVLSVTERRREIGMLRAVGTSRAQVRRSVAVEALLTTAYGALVGVVAGVGTGAVFLRTLGDVGVTAVVVPWPLVAAVVGGAVVVGAVAASWPASHAARIPPVQAVRE